MFMVNYDVVIVGAGFAGLSMAYNLPRYLKVLIIDRKKSLDNCIKSTGLITEKTRRTFSEFFNIDKYITNKIDSLCVIAPDFNKHFISSSREPWIYSTDTTGLIKSMSLNLPKNVDLMLNSGFCDYSESPHLTVKFLKNNEEKIVTTRFLVGADGANSRVGKTESSGNKKLLFGYEKVFYGDILLGNKPDKTVYHFWFGEFSLGYGGWLSPTVINNKKAFRIGLAQKADEVSKSTKINDFIEILKQRNLINIKTGSSQISEFAGVIPIGGPIKRVINKNVLLIGDAAGLCGAFAADGIRGAIVSGKIAANQISKNLNCNNKLSYNYYPEIQRKFGLMSYYKSQLKYRFIWDLIKSSRTFDALFDLINSKNEIFLKTYCDNKEKKKSLIKTFIKIKNLPIILKFGWYLFLDFFRNRKIIIERNNGFLKSKFYINHSNI